MGTEASVPIHSLLNHHEPPQPGRLFFADVLADFFRELLLHLPWTVFLELADHTLACARNAKNVLIGRGVQIDWNEAILFQLVGGFLPHVLADLFIELRPALPWTVLCKLARHTATGAGHK